MAAVATSTWPIQRQLAQVFRHLEGVADRPPDGLDVYPVGQSALDRAPAKLVEHEVPGHALRIHVAELGVHPVPEFRQPHVAQGTAGPDQTCAVDKPALDRRAGDGDGSPGYLLSDVSVLNPMCRY